MQSSEIRERFLRFFAENNHKIVNSSPLIPAEDPSLLFTNAGMVQFKDLFLGLETRDYSRAATIQKCLRAGGKHNDLENVGYTARHHTFFEMLGNFSFGDYSKREAIKFAWDFLTKELKLPKEKLWITVYENDDEAEQIWLKEMQVSAERFSRCGEKDNFWAMGDTGPCGPCSEIFYDHGSEIAGGPPGSIDADGDRYVEVWNLVFMQYERDENGNLKKLPKPSIDTGMGLERISAILQKVHDNYDIDIFKNLITAAAQITNTTDLKAKSLRVIADHIRACSFLIVDGVRPSNEGRGYVLRRIIRRSIRHGHQLGQQNTFFYRLTYTLIQEMGAAYPELINNQNVIEKILKQEEEQFRNTLSQGLKILATQLEKVTNNVLSGEVVFKLYDTYGFPLDLTADWAREHDFTIDVPGFEKSMSLQRETSRKAAQFGVKQHELTINNKSEFCGYEQITTESKVEQIFIDGNNVNEISRGEKGIIILDKTPFYAEAGGQIGDTGILENSETLVLVTDTKKQDGSWLHYVEVLKGNLEKGKTIIASVDEKRRAAIASNHSATHLLHAALRQVLGNHVVQKGSLVAPDKLRFDFSHFKSLSKAEIITIEEIVNSEIQRNTAVEVDITSMEEAKAKGAMALFDEKYGDKVRILQMGESFSIELCGGTHTKRTGDIGLFKIIEETSIASGVRRLEAVTGMGAISWVHMQEQLIANVADKLRVNKNSIENKIDNLIEQIKRQEKAQEELQNELNKTIIKNLRQRLRKNNICGINILVTQIDVSTPKALRSIIEDFKNSEENAVMCLATVISGKVHILAFVSSSYTKTINASDLVQYLAKFIDGKGGGKADLAQAGGVDPSRLTEGLISCENRLKEEIVSFNKIMGC